MKKFLKITLLVVLTAGIIGTFVFLWMKSRPKVVVYETVNAEITDLQKTTVATGKVEPRDEILISLKSRVSLTKYTKKPDRASAKVK